MNRSTLFFLLIANTVMFISCVASAFSELPVELMNSYLLLCNYELIVIPLWNSYNKQNKILRSSQERIILSCTKMFFFFVIAAIAYNATPIIGFSFIFTFVICFCCFLYELYIDIKSTTPKK